MVLSSSAGLTSAERFWPNTKRFELLHLQSLHTANRSVGTIVGASNRRPCQWSEFLRQIVESQLCHFRRSASGGP